MRLKALHQKNLVKAKKIIVDSITDHILPQVSSVKTLKIFDSWTKIFEGKNINQNMTLRNQLNEVKIQNADTIQSYFTRVSQIKEQLEAVKEEVKNAEVVIAILNGLPRSWDSSLLRNVCQKEMITFNRIWEECTQEEDRLIIREENMGATEYQVLMIQRRSQEYEELNS